MKTFRIVTPCVSILLLIIIISGCDQAEKSDSANTAFIDASKVRAEIEALGKQFSEDFQNKDSVALANFYAEDGMLGNTKGHDELVTAFSRMMAWGETNGMPTLKFIVTFHFNG